MSQIEATILGQSYALACPPDGELLLREAIAIVDREMSAIRDAGKVKARERMAVLAALNLAYQQAEAAARKGAQTSAPQRQAAAAEGTVNSTHSAGDSSPDIDIEHLIRRIDEALGDDNHLL